MKLVNTEVVKPEPVKMPVRVTLEFASVEDLAAVEDKVGNTCANWASSTTSKIGGDLWLNFYASLRGALRVARKETK